jgi:hypothetical protein
MKLALANGPDSGREAIESSRFSRLVRSALDPGPKPINTTDGRFPDERKMNGHAGCRFIRTDSCSYALKERDRLFGRAIVKDRKHE